MINTRWLLKHKNPYIVDQFGSAYYYRKEEWQITINYGPIRLCIIVSFLVKY